MALSKAQKKFKKWTSQDWGYVTTGDKKNLKKQEVGIFPASVRKKFNTCSKSGY